RIEKETERLRLLIENIMVLGKHSDKKSELPLKKIDITQMITQLIQETIEPVCQCRIPIEAIGSERPILSHPLLLEHVILNLISNALKYSAGAPSPFIQIRFTPKSCQVIVQDYGIGIPTEDQAKLFQPFYRGQNVLDIPGTGLGLVIARELTEKLNGSIQLSSTLNKGTKVIVDLPKTTPS
ncbi:MAG: sensor histidine kinase, partial [Bacteroidota bacterium]